jgi:hypothetical protein
MNGVIVALDNVHMEYRVLTKYEVMTLQEMVKDGLAKIYTFAEPAWTETLGSWRAIKAPPAAAGGSGGPLKVQLTGTAVPA